MCPEPDRWAELADASRRDELERHLDECDDCRALVAALTHEDETPAMKSRLVPPGGRIGRYVIEGTLGAGGMGVVLAARDPQLERTVALKLVRMRDRSPAAAERARTRLFSEARAMARLSHPNVVAVHEVLEEGDELVIVMERVDGADLGKWLAEAPRSRAEKLRALVGAGYGLAAAHAAGLVHRDIKPANILVGRDGRGRLTDLGLTAAIASDNDDAALGAFESRLVGTPGYLAPEIMRGARGDERSDQYAFAITTQQIMFGAAPPRGRIAKVLRRALAESSTNRYPSIASFISALERAAKPRWPVVVGTAVLACMIFTGVLLWPRPVSVPICTAHSSWTPARRAVMAGLLVDDSPNKRMTADTLALLDSNVEEWADAVCRDHIPAHRECLEGERRDLEATLGALTNMPASRAIATVAHLASPDDCKNLHSVANPAEAQRVNEELRALTALAATGRYADVRTRVDALTKTTQDPDLSAEIAYRRANWTLRAGAPNEALDLAHQAVALAERAHDDGARLQAMVVLVSVLDDLGRANETHTLAPLLVAAAERQPLSDHRRATVENVLANLEATAGNAAAAEPHYRAALTAIQHEYADKSAPEVAGAMQNLGANLHALARPDDARPLLEQSVAMFEATVGPNHPDLAIALTELGTLAQEAEDYDHASAYYERAIAIRTKALGPEHPYVSEPVELLARVEQARGHSARARDLYRRAIAIAAKGFGESHPLVAVAQGHLAELVSDRTEAFKLATAAVAAWDSSGAALPDAFDVRFFLAQLDYADGAHTKARALAEVARAGYANFPAPYNERAGPIAAWLTTHP